MATELFPEVTFPEIDSQFGSDLGYQAVSNLKAGTDHAADFGTLQASLVNEFRARAAAVLGDIPERGAEILRKAERATRENPWTIMAAAAAGALALGFVAGRALTREKFVAYTGEESFAGYDE